MSEILWNRYEWQENRNNENISVFDSQKYQNDLQGFYKNNINNPESIQWLKTLVDKQDQDKSDLKESLEKPVLNEAREELDKEAMINEAKTMLYEQLWISNNVSDNNWWENFSKWIIDTLVLDNYDLAIQVWETNWKVILDWLSQLASWEWIKQVAQAIWESFWNLLTWDAYEKWKAVADLWIIWTWVWAWVYVWKKGVKLWMKQISKLRSNKENLVNNSSIKQVVWETNNKVADIIPKKQLDFENALVEDIAKLWNKDRLEAWKVYLNRDLTADQQDAVIKAHNVWKDREWAWINNYNQSEISEKTKILKDVWFTKEERRILLKKWVCGKEVDSNLLDAEFVNNRMKLSDFDNLTPNEKLEVLWLKKEFVDLINNSWFIESDFDIISRYRELQYWDMLLKKKKPIDYQTMINKALETLKNRGIDEVDAMLLFASTDKYLFHNINWALREIKELTGKQKAFIDRFDQALGKMPDLEWKHIIRWDSHHSWLSNTKIEIDWRKATNLEISELVKKWEIDWLGKWEKITLDAYTYIADKKNDVFLGKYFPKNDTLVLVKWDNWWIKDISSVSLYRNFGDRLPWWWLTQVEWIIERWKEVEFIDSRVISNAVFNEWKVNKKIVLVRVKN